MYDFRELIKARDVNTLILPLATIIETGNHIAHISNGDERRKRATIFAQYLEKTAKGEAPWEYYFKELDNEELILLYWNVGKYISEQMENQRWGSSYIDEMAKFISKNCPEIKGFNRRGLYRMKQFYPIASIRNTPTSSSWR